MEGLGPRRTAMLAVAEALRRRMALDDVLATLPDTPDPALARAIAITTFRRLGFLNRIIGQRLAKGPPDQDRAFALLATGAAQILLMAAPDHSAVDLAVETARRDPRLAHLAGLANAVLRRIARERDPILAEPALPFEDTPDWLAASWTAAFGRERALAIAAAHLEGAALDLTVASDAAGWAERLGGIVLPTGNVRLSATASRTPVAALPGYEEGAWWVQDAAASLPARLLALQPGERVLDLCAAPGGKTAQLAAAGAQVLAVDRSEPRLGRLRENLRRLRLGAETLCADALELELAPFDAVLLDAPCSSTGTLRRHPDVAWTKRPDDLGRLVELQRRLLDRAADLVRPGGRLVYCVCSLEPEEGERQAEAFLARRPDFVRHPVDAAALGLTARFLSDAADLRTTPELAAEEAWGRPGLDGFFAVRLSRAGP